jgi:hypothetical protein
MPLKISLKSSLEISSSFVVFMADSTLTIPLSVFFVIYVFRDEKQQLLLGTRRANRQPTNISSSVLSSDSMHIGILAAAAHAAANNSPFTIFYNPRSALSSELMSNIYYAWAFFY